MSISIHIEGYREPNEKWQSMKDVWDACVRAGIPVPEVVDEFFKDVDPCDLGENVDIKKCVREFYKDYSRGFIVELERIPAEVKTIKFYYAV